MSKIEYFILKLNYPVDSETWATDIARTGAQGGCKPLVLCQDCKHRPTLKYCNKIEGFNLRFPDNRCPCQCEDDPFYSWMPSDDWHCGNGELKDK